MHPLKFLSQGRDEGLQWPSGLVFFAVLDGGVHKIKAAHYQKKCVFSAQRDGGWLFISDDKEKQWFGYVFLACFFLTLEKYIKNCFYFVALINFSRIFFPQIDQKLFFRPPSLHFRFFII